MTAHSVRRVNSLARALDATSYLEVGVYEGETFNSIEVARKVAVDPRQRFEYTGVAPYVFHQATSDQFFTNWSGAVFDIVFLDGLHTFEQTFRDLCSTLTVTHERSCILIDDVWPSDIYSSLADLPRAKRLRRELSSSPSDAWHGDVFKVIFALEQFFPTLNYRTMFGSGNPQTLVWRSRAGERPAVSRSWEQIGRMDYFDLHDWKEGMRPCSEEVALEMCIRDLTRG